MTAGRPPSGDDLDALTDAVLVASRVFVAVAIRSLEGVPQDVTVAQFRALVLVCDSGRISPTELAGALGVHPSTATRLCDRLADKRLIRRATAAASRREVTITATKSGRHLVATVTTRRRGEIRAILGRLPPARRTAIVRDLAAFADAAGEVPEQAWSVGWTPSVPGAG